MHNVLYIDLSEGINEKRLEKIGDYILDGGNLESRIRGITIKQWLFHYGIEPAELEEEAKKRRKP